LDEIANKEIATIYNNSQTKNNTIALDEIANKEIATIYNDSQTENTTAVASRLELTMLSIEKTRKKGKKT
jgi:hypothetical protein